MTSTRAYSTQLPDICAPHRGLSGRSIYMSTRLLFHIACFGVCSDQSYEQEVTGFRGLLSDVRKPTSSGQTRVPSSALVLSFLMFGLLPGPNADISRKCSTPTCAKPDVASS